MKKIIAIILILALIFTFAACGNNPDDNNGEEGNGSQAQESGEDTQDEGGDTQEGEDESEKTNPFSGLTGDTYELSLGSIDSVPVGEGVTKLCDLVEEYSTGSLVIRQTVEDTPTSDAERLQKVIDGELDIAIGLSDNFSSVVKDLHIFDVYYLFESKEEVYDVALSNEIKDSLEASFEAKGLKCLSLWGNGFSELTTNKKKVTKPKNLKNLKVATSDTKIDKAAWEAMGAKPVAMDSADRVKAIVSKEVGGQESSL
ncbi:MAG: TRAP transporter substrate-binding protein DctP, partial [Clostridiales bacterium]|nr:TRAP transporter substrate-binding protein DctP [Clostridiales bacterium]